MDTLTPEKRSENMRRVRSTNTKPEVFFRKLLHARGYRYSLYSKKVPGHPDLWMPKYNLAVFVNGCFWHRHAGCVYASVPKSRTEFWNAKFEANVKRDMKIRGRLEEDGIRQLTIWECTVKKMSKDPDFRSAVMKEIEDFIRSDGQRLEI